MSTRNANLEIVLTGWIEALRRGDLETLERHLHPEVVWQGVREDLICPDRAHVLEAIADPHRTLPKVESLELAAEVQQVLLGMSSPDFTEFADEPLDGELYMVFTIGEGLIVRIEDFKTRDEASAAMLVHRDAAADDDAPAPAPVSDLVPFVHVADVGRSIAFYELLGFAVTDTHTIGDRLDWAGLESAGTKLMLAHAHAPIHPGHQGVLFYLGSADLAALQRYLRANSVRAGAIRDGSPGPREEMCVRDPDGYTLMIAQTDAPAGEEP